VTLEHVAGTCPLCGATEARTICRGTDRLFGTTDREFLVVECSQCRLMRLFPEPSNGELASYYPKDYWYDPQSGTADRWAERWRRLALRDHLRFAKASLASAPPEGVVLDVGCGGGLFLRELAPAGRKAVGLDSSLQGASVAWSSNGVPVVCASLKDAPLPQASCALITMYHVLEHLRDPAGYLEAAHQLLLPGGRLIVQVPNAACWQFLLLGENWNGLDIPRHLIDFRGRELEGLLQRTGFQILRTKHFSLRDNPAGLASSIAPWLDPMGRRCRARKESPRMKLFKDAIYFGLMVASIPFAWLEAACGAGSSIMIEATPKP
jgi:SAM-dependent methyltransferase